MTDGRLDDDQVGQRLAQALETEANNIEVGDAWDAIARRLLVSDGSNAAPVGSVSATRRRRVLSFVAAGIGVAAMILLVVVLGWRSVILTPAPVAPATTSVPRYDASIPALVVYRTTAGKDRTQNAPVPRTFTITPERMRTDSPDVGRAALEAMFDTPPVQPGNTYWLRQKTAQKIDVTSVTVSGGLIRVELNGFSTPQFKEPEAHVLAQTWVRTLQDTLGVRDDVLITLQGRPFWLYGAIDTAKPLTRDESVRVVRPDGFDSPRTGDVAPSTFVLLGSATAGTGQSAHVRIVDLDTGAIAYEQEMVGPAAWPSPVDFEPVLKLEPGRYRATVNGHGTVGVRDITFAVVS